MTRLKLNPEFFRRHLFALVVMLGIGGWFAYDGLIVYPRTDAAALYEAIEKVKPAEGVTNARLEAFKRQKIQSQYGFAGICLFAGVLIGLHLLAVSRFHLEFDDAGLVFRGHRYTYDDLAGIDDSKWRTKGRAVVRLSDGAAFVLDSWHFVGAETVFEKFSKIPPCRQTEKIV